MRLYLDLCALKRPYDRKTSDLVVIEALSVARLIEAAENGLVEIVSSAILDAENSRNPDPVRRDGVAALMSKFESRIEVDDEVAARARFVETLGFRPLDALHAACAESGRCDFLVTTDKGMLSTGQRIPQKIRVRIANPIEVVRLLEETTT